MKDENMIEELYNLLQEKMSYRLYEGEILRSQKVLMDMIDDPQKEPAILDYGTVYEKAGFYNGFRFAAWILSDCIDKKSACIPGMPSCPLKE